MTLILAANPATAYLTAAKLEAQAYDSDARLYKHATAPHYQVVDEDGLALGERSETESDAWHSAADVCRVCASFGDLSPAEQDLVIGHQYNGKIEPVAPPADACAAGIADAIAEVQP